AYRLADMMQAYPVARGAAPLMTAGASLLAVGDPISAGALAGIAVLATGVLLVALAGHRRFAPPSRLAIVCALLTAATISAYTIIDGVGAREAGDPNAYAASLFALDAYPMLLVCFWRQGVAGMKAMLGFLTPGLVGGAMSLAAYWIVIWAMTRAPIALVAAVRESSVLFGGLIALFVLKEPATPIRIMAAALILAGLAIMRLA
ncbi:MAG TPA: EamA family transporter, partial [Roseiarcus sp.]|nr:EamA family transporter [Roseiarcus sp.]